MWEQEESGADKMRNAIFWTGVALIVTGVIALLGLAIVAVDIIRDPEGVALVKWLAAQADKHEFYLRGFFEATKFEFNLSPALQYVFFGIIGLLVMNIFAAIVKGFISIGAQLVQVAGIQQADKIDGKKSNKFKKM
ncbi:MAG: hypothetical protein Q3M24_05440 [Candidatus Electrothrix aestuarii]|uniref:Uncharacterized protein n=1 Tax=Candidatus Electrothrix aestuarii TaxID=3062594 RepID=A0AAU8LZ99_9BACT|nr:hypothetical protein [Candidatus Electrothrix aestuarii]WPD23224.1 MAG: hypothetical protein SD837_01410 [Candidatus Electrothrix sp. GW3-3]